MYLPEMPADMRQGSPEGHVRHWRRELSDDKRAFHLPWVDLPIADGHVCLAGYGGEAEAGGPDPG